jgi:hypothetical protein
VRLIAHVGYMHDPCHDAHARIGEASFSTLQRPIFRHCCLRTSCCPHWATAHSRAIRRGVTPHCGVMACDICQAFSGARPWRRPYTGHRGPAHTHPRHCAHRTLCSASIDPAIAHVPTPQAAYENGATSPPQVFPHVVIALFQSNEMGLSVDQPVAEV